MIGTIKTLVLRALLSAVIVLGMAASPVFAQSFLSSVESVIGPIVPNCGIGATFRSEVGTGLSIMALNRARLSGGALSLLVPGFTEVRLKDWANLDESPLRFDVYTKFRLWRFGARAQWSQFEDRSLGSGFVDSATTSHLGRFDFTGLRLGADFDAIQHCWLVLGASVDFYLSNPEFRGFIRQPHLTPGTFFMRNIDLTGKSPTTIGVYARYIPPEIINIPVHAEFYANFPLLGSPLTQYGGALVFRPQIYRFDVALKVLLEQNHLKLDEQIPVVVSGVVVNPSSPLKLDTEWLRYGVDLAIYF